MRKKEHINFTSTSGSLNLFDLPVPSEFSAWRICPGRLSVSNLFLPRGRAYKAEQLLIPEELTYILNAVNTHGWRPVLSGASRHTEYEEKTKVGCYRASANSVWLAEVLWERLKQYFGGVHVLSENSLAEWEGAPLWRAEGVSSVMRFVKYTNGCEALLPHYDESITFENGTKSMVRVLIYFTSSDFSGGETYFVKDPDIDKPYTAMQRNAFEASPPEADVLLEIAPVSGGALIFDHKILHGSRFVTGSGDKITLRTDILFTKCK